MVKKKTYCIVTHGCQANEHDSEKISWILENIGYEWVDNFKESDLIIYNTCLVRENAELKLYGQLGALKNLKRKKPDIMIAVCGCMMEREESREVILSKYKHVDIIFGTKNIDKLPQLINRYEQTGKTVVDVVEDDREIAEDIGANRKYPFKAYVDIMYGCNNFCTYCIVPYTRGREKSREPKNVIAEVEELANKGYKEITLLGQNVNSYGNTLDYDYSFAKLLREINKINGIERIRFMTSHPKDLSDELISAIAELDKVCEHFHLPVQSGSNRVLKAMNRKYTREDYINLVEKLKEAVPGIAITTDIIVGFPGETEEDFNDTLDLVKKVGYDSAFTFLYSIREGTYAANMENQIPNEVKHERFQRLLDTLYPIFYEKNIPYKDKIVDVLVEEVSKNDENVLSGRTRTGKLVHFQGSKDLIGEIVDIKIDKIKSFTLEGYKI